MVGKVGLVGGVFVVWLATFAVMGSDVMPAITAHHDPASATSPGVGVVTPTVTPSSSPASASARSSPSASTTPAPASLAATVEKLATSPAIAGHLLVDRPNARRSSPPVLTFRMATFNALGASHTDRRGKDPRRASGYARTHRAGQYVLDNDIDLVGFQELQASQRSAFMSATGGRYALYPGNELRSMDGENSIAYRLDTWELVKADSIPIPYFGGRPRNMPILLLRNKQTGITAYFTNFHNPADTREFGKQGRWRAAATAREADLFGQLRDDGYPLFVTGDMNDRQSWFCAVAGAGDLRAAAGGDGARNGCSVAGGFRIDWIAGSHDVAFSNYREDRSGLVGWMTDHPVVMTDVTIDAADFPKSVKH